MIENVKVMNNDLYLPVLADLIKEGKEVSLLIKGSSMSPFLVDGRDVILISKPDINFYKGEMAFYIRENNQYVMHRIYRIDHKKQLYFVGDAQTEIEGPLSPSQVVGVVHKVIRKGKLIKKGNFWWWFFETIWIRVVPLRRYLQKCYCFVKKQAFRRG